MKSVEADSVTVETGYPTEGLEDLVWASQYLGYENPGELQKAGVEVLRFLLVAITQAVGDDCESNLGDSLDPTGSNRYKTVWNEEEIEALKWLAEYYCLSEPQAQMLGGNVLTFLAGLDASMNGEKENEDTPPESVESSNTETLNSQVSSADPIKLVIIIALRPTLSDSRDISILPITCPKPKKKIDKPTSIEVPHPFTSPHRPTLNVILTFGA